MLTIAGCDPMCKHEWRDAPIIKSQAQTSMTADGTRKRGQRPSDNRTEFNTSGGHCIHCGGMKCGLGAESTPEAFIGHLMLVMREMWRVLRDDGVCFVNLGDSYNGSGGAGGDYGPGGIKEGQPKFPGRKISALKPKDLMMIPARFALAAQADGWYLRSDIIWHKPNPMPESVTDRPTKSHEYVYLLTKSEKYFYDAEAVKEENAGKLPYGDKLEFKMNDEAAQGKHGKSSMFAGGSKQEYIEKYYTNGRNRRSVWTIATSPYNGTKGAGDYVGQDGKPYRASPDCPKHGHLAAFSKVLYAWI